MAESGLSMTEDDNETVSLYDDKSAMEEQSGEIPMPLFFKDPKALEAERHLKAGLNQTSDVAFARESNMVPIHQFEFMEVARHYPVVIVNPKHPTPVAVIGLDASNHMVNAKGEWRKNFYVPAYVRKYPFALMKLAGSERFALCVDEGSASFDNQSPELAFYDENGEASEASKRALEFCGQYQKSMDATVEFCQAMLDKGLLEGKGVTVKTPDGKEYVIEGVMQLNEEKWRALDDETYIQWRQKGWIQLAHILIMSNINWKYLPSAARENAQADK